LDETDKVAARWIEVTQQRRIPWGTRLVPVVTEHLERKHQANAIPAQPRGARIPQTAHVATEEERRFLVHERNAAHGAPRREGLKHARDLEERVACPLEQVRAERHGGATVA
jgi:hypothetical protein